MRKLMRVPPSPSVMADLYMEYLRVGKPQGLNFFQYLNVIGYSNPAHNLQGMDDAADWGETEDGLALLNIPNIPLKGDLFVKVLLVDFIDRPGYFPREHYEDLLFSQGTHPTGSMFDYFQEVSSGKVAVQGTVHGWLRMPQAYSYYTNKESGLKWDSYPRNAPRMAEDAVRLALNSGVTFDQDLDVLGKNAVTALFIVHAGRGAEELHQSIRDNEIWSHKWILKNPIQVAPGLRVSSYLTVPQECEIGVCCHELGHLAFQWQDFYDPKCDCDEDKIEWSGTGVWDLMASGSYNDGSKTPAHPAALHKMQHGWVDVEDIAFGEGTASEVELEIEPVLASSGKVYRITSPKYEARQYLLLENRTFSGFDSKLPGEGLLVWRVDERGEQFAPHKPGLLLLQADGLHELEFNKWDDGDSGDPFPGAMNRRSLKSTGHLSTSFPDQVPSGITLTNIRQMASDKNIRLTVNYDGS